MKENSLIIENNQTENISIKDNQPENRRESQTESEYLQMFCKDISKINNRDEMFEAWRNAFANRGIYVFKEAFKAGGHSLLFDKRFTFSIKVSIIRSKKTKIIFSSSSFKISSIIFF